MARAMTSPTHLSTPPSIDQLSAATALLTHHASRLARRDQVSQQQWPLYELVVRHFLACCSRAAVGSETKATLSIAGEVFTTR